MKSTRIASAILALSMLNSIGTAAGEPGSSQPREAWQRHCREVSKEPALLRFYTFDPLDSSRPIANLAGKEGELTYQASPAKGGKPQPPAIVEGRWAGKKAVRLDAGCLIGESPALSDKGFTVEAWIRVEGLGALRGNNGATNGTLLALGNGYWEGWRITTSYPEKTLGFEIGRPQPSNAVGIRSTAVTDRTWRHLAATWDSRKMTLFVDGLPAASGEHPGVLTMPQQKAAFRIGYANAGIGSIILDVDEVALFGRALSAEEIAGHACFDSPASQSVVTKLQAAAASLAEKKYRAAGRELVEALGNPGLPERYRTLAVPMLTTVLRQSPIHALSPKAAERLLALPEISPLERIDLRLAAAHGLFLAGDFSAARDSYGKLLEETDLPAYVRGLAQSRIGRTYYTEREWPGAKTAYAKLAGMKDVPPHLNWEAEQRLGEIARIESGLPAVEPAAGRTRLTERPAPRVTLHVAPDGAESGDGTPSKPFAGLEQARDALRRLKAAGSLTGGAEVVIHGGEYRVRQTFTLESQDSGNETAPVVYRAADGEKPVFRGGIRLSGFQPLRDSAVLARLPEEARGKVVALDVKKLGLTDLLPLRLGGFASGSGFKTYPMIELFFDGRPMPLARWPNEGFVRVADVAVADDHQIHGRRGSKTGRLTYEGDRPRRWKDDKDAMLYGYWFFDWADSYERIASIDPAQREITLATPYHRYGYRKDAPYYAVNLLSEIDIVGEWYLDRAAGILYFYPPSDPARAVVEISTLDQPVLDLDRVSGVVFEGLTWDLGCVDAIHIRGGENCLVAGCTVRRFGGNGMIVEGRGHGIMSCDVYSMGRGGLAVSGGDRKTLTPGGCFVENCDIHDLSRVDHTYTPAVLLSGVGNRIAHNALHDINSSAIRLGGNDHVVEYNEVHHAVEESDDQGGVDMFGNATYRGNVFRYNYWHHIGNQHNPAEEPACGQAGIRLDDAISGQVIYGNVFYRCSAGKTGFGGVQIHGGKDNWIDNNLFVDCMAAISFSPWHEGLWTERTGAALEASDVDRELYVKCYPELGRLNEDLNVNLIGRNVALGCGEFLRRDRGYARLFANLATDEDPGFAAAGEGDFRLPDPSTAIRMGWEPIPLEQIGLYTDEYRK
ncbi:MAG: hypothetical protein GXY83_02670 [Rhodopirellula sp.]|nr:hypothetical protein [Rhodopirellula sp.]